MQELLDVINKLSEKYKFTKEEIDEIQQAVFNIENGEGSMINAQEDFVSPEGEVEESVEVEDDD